MSTNIKYVAELKNVREISLIGSADLSYWTDVLAKENLKPTNFEGTARITISATDGRFMRIPFREFLICVAVQDPSGDEKKSAAYLCQAFNSVKFFAFVERKVFSTPYQLGIVHLDLAIPLSMHVMAEEQLLIRARMSTDESMSDRETSDSRTDNWRGPIYLPTEVDGKPTKPKLFYARIGGQTEIYPFELEDTITLKPTPKFPVIQQLFDSGFTGQEWHVREAASHAKSKTYPRT